MLKNIAIIFQIMDTLHTNVYNESRYQCMRCSESPALCADPCFRQFHVRIGVALENSDSSDSFDASDVENEL